MSDSSIKTSDSIIMDRLGETLKLVESASKEFHDQVADMLPGNGTEFMATLDMVAILLRNAESRIHENDGKVDIQVVNTLHDAHNLLNGVASNREGLMDDEGKTNELVEYYLNNTVYSVIDELLEVENIAHKIYEVRFEHQESRDNDVASAPSM